MIVNKKTLLQWTYWACCLFIFSCKENVQTVVNIDSTFIKWNTLTLQSLTKQLELSKDSIEKSLYENRILAFRSFIGIESEEDMNPNSIRYKFLQTVIRDSDNQEIFFIVEANESGEQVLLKNYIINPIPGGKANVDVYTYTDGEWNKDSVAKRMEFISPETLSLYKTSFGLGFNNDDVIMTQFENQKVIGSEYFLYATINDLGHIKRVLSVY